MPRKKLQKSLQEYLSKIKSRPAPHIHNPKSFILSGCKHPKTQSFAADHTRNDEDAAGSASKDDGAALADIDRFLFENFSSLYVRDDDDGAASRKDRVRDNKGKRSNNVVSDDTKESPRAGPVLFDSPRFLEPPRDLCGSARFFVGPGSSSSLVEEARSSTTSTATAATTATTGRPSFNESVADNGSTPEGQKEVRLPDGCIAVLAHSSSPYEDFRRSMREMVDARTRSRGRVGWEFMEELLFCYLSLNEKRSHKYILSAFVDLIVALRRSRDTAAPPARHREAAGRAARESRRRKPRREIL